MAVIHKPRGLHEVEGFLFDIDGVLLLGSKAIPGAKELLDGLRNAGKKVMFVSNTSSRSRQQALEQFSAAGIFVDPEELFLASEKTGEYLAREKPGAKAFVLGSKGLISELQQQGIDPLLAENPDPHIIDYVVVGKDHTVNYEKLTTALRAIASGARFVAVNCDPTVPASDGLEPGAGALVAAISAMVGREPDIAIGKPSTFLLELAMKQMGLGVEECVMVGDTIEIDIVAGNRLGMTTVLVLSGNATSKDLSSNTTLGEGHPDLVLPSIKELTSILF